MKTIHPQEIRKDILQELASRGGVASARAVIEGLIGGGEYHADSSDLVWFHIMRLSNDGSIKIESNHVTLPEGLSAVIRLTSKGEETLRPFADKLFHEIFSAPGIAKIIYLMIGAVLGAVAGRLI